MPQTGGSNATLVFRLILSMSYLWVVTFDVVVSLADAGAEDATALATSISEELADDSLAASIEAAIGVAVQVVERHVVLEAAHHREQLLGRGAAAALAHRDHKLADLRGHACLRRGGRRAARELRNLHHPRLHQRQPHARRAADRWA